MKKNVRDQTLSKATVLTVAFLFLGSLALGQNNAHASNEKRSSLSFSLPDKHGFPASKQRSSFDCLDKIYAVTELSNFKKGKYTIEFRWIDPHGETRERTQYDFIMRDEPTTRLWAWLELSRAQGAGMIQWLNPAAGLEEFIGDWSLKLILNGKQINIGKFEVIC